MEVTSSTRLGCGRDIDAVWENINHPPTAHEITCPDCRAARLDLMKLRGAAATLHADDDADPELQASPEVIARVLDIARSEVRRGRRLPLRKPLAGELTDELTVSEQAVAAVIRRTGDLFTGIQVRRCTVELIAASPESEEPERALVVETADVSVDSPTSDVVVTEANASERQPSDVRVALRVSVDGRSPIIGLVDRLRESIIEVVEREVGLTVVAVNVAVEDVHDV